MMDPGFISCNNGIRRALPQLQNEPNGFSVTVVFEHGAVRNPSPAHTGISKILNDVMNTSCAD